MGSERVEVGVGILDRSFKQEQEETIPPRLGFGTSMENIYIFWDMNGIWVPRPKLALLTSLLRIQILLSCIKEKKKEISMKTPNSFI